MSLSLQHSRNDRSPRAEHPERLFTSFAYRFCPEAGSSSGATSHHGVKIRPTLSFELSDIDPVCERPPLQTGEVDLYGRASVAVCQNLAADLCCAIRSNDRTGDENHGDNDSNDVLHETLPAGNPFLQSRLNRVEGKCDPKLFDILVERTAIYNRALSYLLSAAIVSGLGFFAATAVF